MRWVKTCARGEPARGGVYLGGLVLGLVVAGWVKGEVSEEFAGLGCDYSDVGGDDE